MTNGEKMISAFPNGEVRRVEKGVVFSTGGWCHAYAEEWWNAECEAPTTKNNLGVDCISRADARHLIAETFRKNLLGMTFNKMFKTLYEGVDNLPSVTPQFSSGLDKNSKKLEKGTTKNDCEHCSKTYGTLGCCDFVSNEPVYSCKEGHEEYARGIRKLGTTTKNNLGVDCISRADAIQIMQDKAKKLTNEDTINGLCGAVAILFELPSVTLQEPRKGHWIVDVHRIRTFGSKNETHDYSVHCDKCNYEWDYTTDKEGSLVSNYCPNCGADMREVKE